MSTWEQLLRFILHYGMHFAAPILIAWLYDKTNWVKNYKYLLLTMLIDLDHVFASPMFDPNRCSIGFHPLHTNYAALIYIVLLTFPKTRIIGIGLLFHLFTDWIDCFWI